jgi:putative ABC transport system ATP-binding protein
MSNENPIIEIRDVTRVYRMRGGEVHALRGVTLDVAPAEYVSIMGPSGSGKSTLFNMIGGLDRPTAGSIAVSGVRIADLDSRALAWFRCCRIGYIFQTFNLIPTLTALDNVMLAGTFRMRPDSEARDRAAAALEAVGLGDRLTHRPDELSGGQMQRVAIARSLVNDPGIILADEPTGNLDLKTGEAIIELLRDLNQSRGVTVVTVTHDHKMLSVSDRIVWFSSGRIDRIQTQGEFDVKVGHIH